MKLSNWISLLLVLFISGCTGSRSLTHSTAWASGGLPERIVLNPHETGEKGVAVTWRTATDIENSHVQWKKATPNPVNSETTFNLTPGIARTDTVEYQETTNIFKSFRAKLTNLDPGQTYMYRIRSEER